MMWPSSTAGWGRKLRLSRPQKEVSSFLMPPTMHPLPGVNSEPTRAKSPWPQRLSGCSATAGVQDVFNKDGRTVRWDCLPPDDRHRINPPCPFLTPCRNNLFPRSFSVAALASEERMANVWQHLSNPHSTGTIAPKSVAPAPRVSVGGHRPSGNKSTPLNLPCR